MNRRGFLRGLGIGVGATVLPLAPPLHIAADRVTPVLELTYAETIGGNRFGDYFEITDKMMQLSVEDQRKGAYDAINYQIALTEKEIGKRLVHRVILEKHWEPGERRLNEPHWTFGWKATAV